MIDYREILRLDSLGYSRRRISSMVNSSHHTVEDTLKAAHDTGITWPLEDDVTNAELQGILFPWKYVSDSVYAISKKVYPTVGRYSTVLFETNHYSVPCKYRGKATTVKAYPNHIEVWIEGTMVARHDRLFGRKEESLDLQHYLPILAQKGRAIRYARPVQNAVPAQFIDWLECQELTAKEIVEMLTRCLEVGYIAVMAGTVSAKEQPAIQDAVTVPPVDLEAYDSLYGKGAAVS